MDSEMKRLSTFSKCKSAKVRPGALATKGFYYAEIENTIRCYMCQFIMLITEACQPVEDVEKMHKLNSPDCPSQAGHCKAVGKHTLKSGNNKENYSSSFNVAGTNKNVASNAGYDDVDYSFEKSLQSSRLFQKENPFLATFQAVTSRQEKSFSTPECPAPKHRATFSHQLGNVNEEMMRNMRVADNETRDFSQGRDISSREYYMLKHPQFSTEELRLSSFEANIKFPRFQYLNPEGLSKAGFFYQGPIDNVRCFCCDGGLKNFVLKDEPWTEHARWFPRCPFLMQHKDASFIENAKLNTGGAPAAAQNVARSNAGLSSPHTAIIGPYHVDPREVKARMESPTVRVIIDMGYSLDLIHQAIERRLATVGDDFENAQSLLEAIFALEKPVQTQIPREVSAYQATSGPEPTQQFAATTRALPTERMVTRAPVAQAPPAPAAVADFIPTSGGLLRSDDGENIEEVERSTALAANVNNSKQLKKAKKVKKQRTVGACAASVNGKDETDLGDGDNDPETKQLLEENGQLREARRCKVCLSEDVNTVFLPCGHLVCCNTCAPELKNCPVCRTLIRGTVRIFLT